MNLGPVLGPVGAAVGAAVDFARAALGSMSATSGQFVVNHDNVLAAAKIIQTQVDALDDRLAGAKPDLRVVPPGDDVVSQSVASEWNDRLVDRDDSYQKRVQQYVDGLRNLVTQLQDSARQYGYNEDEIASALGTRSA